MGYSTDFEGAVTVTPPLNEHEIAYLSQFAGSRRMRRDKGPYYCGAGPFGQAHEDDVTDYNHSPAGQPGLWCQWIPTEDGTGIEWDGGEKFYDSVGWMRYLIDTFLKRGAALAAELADRVPGRWYPPVFAHFTFDHVVNGEIRAEGERVDDVWSLVVTDNVVSREDRLRTVDEILSNYNLRDAVETLQRAGVTTGEQYGELIAATGTKAIGA